MNQIFLISIFLLILGGILFFVEKRNFYTGLILTSGILELIIYIVDIISVKSDIARLFILMFVYGIVPLIIIFSGFWLIFNGKVMRSKEGRKLANQLSLIIGLDILIICSLSVIAIYYDNMNSYLYIAIIEIILISAYLGFLFVSYLAYSYIYQKLSLKGDLDYIIVLGSGLIGDRVPPLLKSRLDKSIEIYKKQKEKGNNTKIIVSGGQGADELISEASAMGNYLMSQNINKNDIILEDKSRTTYENMKFSKLIMDKSNKYRCIFVTNNYHVFRASIFARKAGVKAHGVGAPTAFYFLPSALIREFIAILVIYKWLNIIVLIFLLSLGVISLLNF
ncbi:YdcF family protein [Clostridium weizhouense]|uniref:YdcF family protein n=1 Tax=Clostridium weizhouense TaxID=2859781 RepID=A0ABS7AQV5_9CLOT|nr:YdcF family protein [Clostridium weizhouense]MBW6410997.1 YdcF family protein [Clostridium weizhouense]